MNSLLERESFHKYLQELTLFDDEFMVKVFEDQRCVELLLSIILDKEIKVLQHSSQLGVFNLQGKSIRIDVLAKDEEDRFYSIEVQRDSRGAIPKRARYVSSLMDANTVIKGERYKDLPETFVIFITEKDVLRGILPLYHIERTIKENGRQFNDQAHIIYVNGRNNEDTELGKLMHDFRSHKTLEMNYEVLKERIGLFKETKEGAIAMSEYLQNLINENRLEASIEGRILGQAEGQKDARYEIVIEIFKEEYPNESTSIFDNCSLEQLKKITSMLIKKVPLKEIKDNILLG